MLSVSARRYRRQATRRLTCLYPIAVLGVLACSDPGVTASPEAVLAKEFAAQVATSAPRAIAQEAPVACARLSQSVPQIDYHHPDWIQDGASLRWRGMKKGPASVLVVAQARGVSTPALRAIQAIREKARKLDPVLIVSLGGLASSPEDLTSLLLGLAGDSKALVVAIPGNREELEGHREAVQKVAESGHSIVDGSIVRSLDLGTSILATLPGVGDRSRLIPQGKGCLHDRTDASQMAAMLLERKRPTLVMGFSPLPIDKSLGAGAVNVGSPALGPLAELPSLLGGVTAVSNPRQEPEGTLRVGAPRSLSVGSIDPFESGPSALVLSLNKNSIRFRSLLLD